MLRATNLYIALQVAFLGALEPENLKKGWGGEITAILAFIVANLVIYWTGWEIFWKLLAAIVLGFVFLGIGHMVNPSEMIPSLDWRGARGTSPTSWGWV